MKTNLLFLLLCVLSQVTVQAQVVANEPDPLLICEENPTGFYTFDLTVREVQITDVPAEVEIWYFELETDAQNNTNAIADPTQYQNVTNPQTIYVRVEDIDTGDYAIVELLLLIDELPVINTEVSNLYAYELIEPDFGLFDLTTKIPEIIGDQTGFEITFYENHTDAEDKVDVIEEPTAYPNPFNPAMAWARVENSSGCFAIAGFVLIPEVIMSIHDYTATNIVVYPNPGIGILNIKSGLKEELEVMVFNLKGQLLISEKVNAPDSGTIKIDFSSQPSGIYLLQLTSEKTRVTKKIIKK